MAALATTTHIQGYEYKFIRLGECRGSPLFGVRDSERETYHDVGHGQARYEPIFERARPDDMETE